MANTPFPMQRFFLPLTWHPIADFPEDWKGKDIKVDLWVTDVCGEERVPDCRWGKPPSGPMKGVDCWLVYHHQWEEHVEVSGNITHWMRVEGPDLPKIPIADSAPPGPSSRDGAAP
jgi:hypothetical protein